MHPIPPPELLDPDRMKTDEREEMTVDEHKSRADAFAKALRDTCEYATELWQHLDATRGYLLESLPTDPRSPGVNPHTSASPTGPNDDEGWSRWIDTYAAVTSILAGPRGDSGFGLSEAKDAARTRREAHNLAVLDAAARAKSAEAPPQPSEPATPAAKTRPDLRFVGLVALVALALRGLRPARRG